MAEETTEQATHTTPTDAVVIEVPQNVKNLHNKGLAALERDNLDFAIDIFYKCVSLAPGYLAARRNLRLAEIAKFKRAGKGKLAQRIASLMGIPLKLKVAALLKAGKAQEALLAAEKLLMLGPLNVDFGKIYASAAVAADQPDAAVLTLSLLREHNPVSIEAVWLLGALYFQIKDYKSAREHLEKVVVLRPNNIEAAKMLKEAEALATLDAGWEEADREGKTYQELLADKDQAVQLEMASKAVKTADDAEALIADARAKIEAEPANLNYYLNLGHLLHQQKRFDEAIEVYLSAQKVSAADPEIDRRMSAAHTSKFDTEIQALKEAGRTEEAAAKQTEKDEYVFTELSERVQRYPNDPRLRFEMGLQYYKYERLDEAIQQLQLAQRSPKDRTQALYYLALCFRSKGLLDLAVTQLKQALELMPGMNAEKLDTMYELALLYQEEGKLEEAAKYFKEIYSVDVTYKDISKRVESIYATQKKVEE